MSKPVLACVLMGMAALVQLPLAAQRVRVPPVLTARAANPMGEAAIVAQGADTSAFLDAAALTDLASALQRVRQQVPTLQRAVPEGQFWAVELFVDATRADAMKAIGRHLSTGHLRHHWRLTRTGDGNLDSLLTRFVAESLSLRLGAGPGDRVNPVLRIVFRYAMNIPVVLEAFRQSPGVISAGTAPDDGPQTGHFYRARREGDTWWLTIDEAVGDCSMSCGLWLRWTAAANHEGVRVLAPDTVRHR